MSTTLVPSTSLRPFERFSNMLEDLFEPRSLTSWMPPVDIKETDREYVFLMEIPGMNKEDLDIEILKDRLVISGKRVDAAEQKTDAYVRRERFSGRFMRSFLLDTPVSEESVHADYTNGLLTIRVPKAAPVVTRRVSIA